MPPNSRTSPAERLAAERKATVHQEHEGGWTEARVDKLKELWAAGKSASECAAILGGGITRAGVCGKVHRLKLAEGSPIRANSPKGHRNKGAPKAAAIRHRAAQGPVVEAKIEAMPDLLPEDGVDVTGLIGIMDLTRDTCRWPHGDPLQAGFGFCGQQIKEGSAYCPQHHRSAYAARVPA